MAAILLVHDRRLMVNDMCITNKLKGFTLVELMVVVAIIGILAAVAIPGFAKYIRDSKKSEARGILNYISDGAVAYYNKEHVFDAAGTDIRTNFFPGCEASGEPAPCTDVYNYSGTRIISQRISPLDPDLKLNEQPWIRLNFEIKQPFLYIAKYTSDPTFGASSFNAQAIASIDSDDDSIFEINGTGNGPEFHISNIVEIKD